MKSAELPYFIIGMCVRLLLIALVAPHAPTVWYVPFMDATTSVLTADPWRVFLETGGAPEAFPYGYVMWMAFFPLVWVSKVFGTPLYLAYALTLLLADVVLFVLLRHLVRNSSQQVVIFYWLSPIVVLATYWFGFNDVIPVAFLCGALYYTQQLRLLRAGVMCGAALSAKLSMGLAVPFFLILLFQNRAFRQRLGPFLKGLIGSVLIFGLPFLFSRSGVMMLVTNPEMDAVYKVIAFWTGPRTAVYLLPLAYLIMLYVAWRIRRPNFEIFNAVLGLSFLLVVMLTPSAPGWYLWMVPILVIYQVRSDRLAVTLVSVFSAVYTMFNLTVAIPPASPIEAEVLVLSRLASTLLDGRLPSLLLTCMFALGVVLFARIWRDMVLSNDYFRVSRKPFAIGISGDSGAGKDTLADALTKLFGSHSTAQLSGDDYHLWDRQKPMWQVMTHLNPMANDLERFANDLLALCNGRSIVSRHYDHRTGKMSRPMRISSNDFVIASGLHALYLPILRSCYDLSIYLDIDENLRRFLKLTRDVHARGHSVDRVMAALERREPDANRFVRPQANYADLTMSLQPIHSRILEDVSLNHPLRFKLLVRSGNNFGELSLSRILVGVCGLHVDVNMSEDATFTELIIEGETSAEDVALAARTLFPRTLDFLDIDPDWQDGILGLMQLVVLSHINQALSRRLI